MWALDAGVVWGMTDYWIGNRFGQIAFVVVDFVSCVGIGMVLTMVTRTPRQTPGERVRDS